MEPAVSNVSSLQSEHGAKLLDDIDRLRSHGISRFVSLPQIIVVGDQSSGKSSVLEAITGVAFPTNDGLCTRFATEVILRRSRDEKASVRIRPSANCSPQRLAELQKFYQADIALDQVSGLIAEATKVMGIAEQVTFSEDVLELEVSGPEQPHLTLVDLPGIFHSTTAKQSEGDPALVTKIVQAYMKEQRSIILAVISGKYDYPVQRILGMLKEVDPEGFRTMGVITKPDAIESESPNEQTFLSLARNSERPLKLGWHVLRNPSFTERRDTSFDRDKTEAVFFANQAPWNTLSSGHVGVAALRLRLGRLLFDHITSELPALVDSLGKEIGKCESILNHLGPQRSSAEDQREYLTIIGQNFQSLAKDGIDGVYEDNYYLAAGQRLRAKVQKAHTDFATRMAKEGQRWLILPKIEFYHEVWETRGLVLPPEGPARPIHRTDYIDKVCDLLEENRGRELQGNYNPRLVRELFQRQSVSWERLALHHAHDVLGMVRVFVEDLIEHVAGKERAYILHRELIEPKITEMEKDLEKKVDELLAPHKTGYPMTLNPDFAAAFAKLNEADKARAEALDDDRQRMDLLACSRLVDCMECYYKVALGVFMDNIAVLAIENCILSKVEGLVSPVKVSRMSAEKLNLLAGESPDDAHTRRETLAKQKVLQDGLETCQKHVRFRPRPPRIAETPSKMGGSTASAAGSMFGLSPSRSSVTSAGLNPQTPATRSSSTVATGAGPEVRSTSHSPTPTFSFTAGPSVSPELSDPFGNWKPPTKSDELKNSASITARLRKHRTQNSDIT
jgi:GTP-binding protein EngB required for normal cell division